MHKTTRFWINLQLEDPVLETKGGGILVLDIDEHLSTGSDASSLVRFLLKKLGRVHLGFPFTAPQKLGVPALISIESCFSDDNYSY